jgi:hypothetical protein
MYSKVCSRVELGPASREEHTYQAIRGKTSGTRVPNVCSERHLASSMDGASQFTAMYNCQLCGKDCAEAHSCRGCQAVFYCSESHMRRHAALQHRAECPRFLAARQRAGVSRPVQCHSGCKQAWCHCCVF